jgi:spore maturation protein SpmB
MKKPMVTDIFVEGAKKGWVIATTSTVPNVLMAFVIIKALQITGALELMGTVFSPVMAVFGLPGEAAAVLIGAWMSMGGAVGGALGGIAGSGVRALSRRSDGGVTINTMDGQSAREFFERDGGRAFYNAARTGRGALGNL